MDCTFRQLDIHVVNHCNVKCKSCMHFAPLAEEWTLDPEEYRNTLESINKEVLDSFERVSLLGGEPLLNENLVTIMDITREFFSSSLIVVHTNGVLLLEMGEDFWNACLSNNISLIISEYPHLGLDYENIGAFLDEKGITYYMMPIQFYKYPLDVNGEQDYIESFNKCTVRPYHLDNMQLVGNKLYMCPFSAYRSIFNKKFNTNMEENDGDYIELNQDTSVDDIVVWRSVEKQFCKYCKSTCLEKIDWEKSNEDITEWT